MCVTGSYPAKLRNETISAYCNAQFISSFLAAAVE